MLELPKPNWNWTSQMQQLWLVTSPKLRKTHLFRTWKRLHHNHYNNPTNLNPQPKPKTKLKNQTPIELVHIKLQQQPKQKTQKTKVSKTRKAAPFSQIKCSSNETFFQKIQLTRDYHDGTKNFVIAEKSKKSFSFYKIRFLDNVFKHKPRYIQ